MSSGRLSDIHDTKTKGKSDKRDSNTNWLRYRAGTQAATIDAMIMAGIHTIEDIAVRLNEIEKKKYPLSYRIRRVRDHIAHLQDGVGDSRGKSHGMTPHGLKVTCDSKGRLGFDL